MKKENRKYRVNLQAIEYGWVEVEAKDEEEALEKAKQGACNEEAKWVDVDYKSYDPQKI